MKKFMKKRNIILGVVLLIVVAWHAIVPQYLPQIMEDQDGSLAYGLSETEYKQVRIMELEEYLRTLYYYDGPLTGNLSFNLIKALLLFKNDMHSFVEGAELSQEEYNKLRARYWAAIGIWDKPRPHFFFSDDNRILAQGGWQEVSNKRVYSPLQSKILCVFDKKTCVEVTQISFRKEWHYNVNPTDPLGIYATQNDTMVQRYKIINYSDGIIHARTYKDGEYFTLPNTRGLGWNASGGGEVLDLRIDVKKHELSKDYMTGKLDDHGGMSLVSGTTHILKDTAEYFFERRYDILQGRYYMNAQQVEKRKKLLSWIKQRDVQEYVEKKDMYRNSIYKSFNEDQKCCWLPKL